MSPLDGRPAGSQVLLAVSGSRTLTGDARDAYLEAATALGDYEQGRALSALVKAERLPK